MSSHTQKFGEILKKCCPKLIFMSLTCCKLQTHWNTLSNGKTARFVKKNGFLTNQTNISHSWFWLNSAFLRHPVHLCKSKLFSTILSSKIIMNMIGKCHTSFLFINNNILASNFNLHVCCEFDAVSMMIYVSTHANLMIVYDWLPELDRLLECVIPLAASELEKPSMHGCNIVEI